MLDAILFDIDDTLCATTAFAQRARRNAVRAMIDAGLAAREQDVYAELEEVIAEFSSNYEHHFDKLLLRLPASASEQVNRALVVAAGIAAYHDTKFRELAPFPGVIELFRELHGAGVRLGVVTHGLSVKQAEKLVRLQLVPYLDAKAIFISDQIGISKPNPKLYQTALRALNLPGSRVMYVGDSPHNDVAPSKLAGMVAVWARLVERHAPGAVEPDHVIASFAELHDLLRARFAIPLAR